MPRRRPAPRHSRVPNLFRRFVSFLVLTTVLLGACFGIFWLLGDTLFPLTIDQNIVFVNSNLSANTSQIIIANFSVEDKKITLVPVDGSVEVEVLGGYGKYQLSKVYPLLKIDKKNDQFMKGALSWATGVVVDRVVAVDDALTEIDQEKLEKILRAEVFQQGYHLAQAKYLSSLYFFAKSVPPEQVSMSNTLNDLPKLSSALKQSSHQECAIAIINTTTTPKLASRLSTIIEQSGLRVVRVDDTSSSVEVSSSTYDTSNLACAQAAIRLTAIFPVYPEYANKPELRHEQRADLVLVLGNDVGKLLVP